MSTDDTFHPTYDIVRLFERTAQRFSITQAPRPRLSLSYGQLLSLGLQLAIQGEETRFLSCAPMLEKAILAVHIHDLLTNQVLNQLCESPPGLSQGITGPRLAYSILLEKEGLAGETGSFNFFTTSMTPRIRFISTISSSMFCTTLRLCRACTCTG
jgi:hypothetical protein